MRMMEDDRVIVLEFSKLLVRSERLRSPMTASSLPFRPKTILPPS
jgi:hypothetical protein